MSCRIPTGERILHYIAAYTDEHGYAPTQREIAKGVGLTSVGAVHRHIEALKKKGFLLEAEHASSRTLAVNKQMCKLPDAVSQNNHQHHICLKTREGMDIILNCIFGQGSVKFGDTFYIQGTHELAGSIVACRELSETDYLSIIDNVSA